MKKLVEKSRERRARGVTLFHLLVVVAMTISAVFAGSSCELGVMKMTSAKAHACCDASRKSPSAPSGYSECCSLTAAPIPAPVIVPATSLVEVLPTYALLDEVLPGAPLPLSVSSSHPPPGPAHFVSFVLRCSLQAHAPPSFVA